VKSRLEDALCRSATLESQHAEHLTTCGDQKARIEQLGRELAMAQDQFARAQIEYVALSVSEIQTKSSTTQASNTPVASMRSGAPQRVSALSHSDTTVTRERV
jgi:hypothetical protein